MDDPDIIRDIGRLVDEERGLRRRSGPIPPDIAQRIGEVEVTLDQCWDLLRQRRALRRSHQPTALAASRPPTTVEGYLQ